MPDNSRNTVECLTCGFEVRGGMHQGEMCRELAALRAELAEAHEALEGMNLARDDEQRQRVDAEAELERMRPVVEAARQWQEWAKKYRPMPPEWTFSIALDAAVDAYLAREVSSEERSHCEHGTWLAEDVCLACPADPNDPDDPRNDHTSSEERSHE